jgi:hypothetical protein
VVTSVPSDSPDDYAALRDLKQKPALREKYHLKVRLRRQRWSASPLTTLWRAGCTCAQDEWVLPFEVVPIIRIEEYGDTPAVFVCDQVRRPPLAVPLRLHLRRLRHVGRVVCGGGLCLYLAQDSVAERPRCAGQGQGDGVPQGLLRGQAARGGARGAVRRTPQQRSATAGPVAMADAPPPPPSLTSYRKVSQAKAAVRAAMVARGEAVAYSEPEADVVSRSGDACIVALMDQWYLDYGEPAWRAQAKQYALRHAHIYIRTLVPRRSLRS